MYRLNFFYDMLDLGNYRFLMLKEKLSGFLSLALCGAKVDSDNRFLRHFGFVDKTSAILNNRAFDSYCAVLL